MASIGPREANGVRKGGRAYHAALPVPSPPPHRRPRHHTAIHGVVTGTDAILKGTPPPPSDDPPEPAVTERWYYARDQRRQGPVPRERLIDLFRNGWLSPDDLVWSEGMADWMPARSFDWLCGATLTRTLRDLVKATLHPGRRRPPPAGHPLPAPQAIGDPPPLVDWDRLEARHLVATAGAFLTALGIAFAVIARTRFALAVTLLEIGRAHV